VRTKKYTITQALQKLTSSGAVDGAAVITRDGLPIASDLKEDIDGDVLAAMAATMIGAAETAVQELKRKSPERIIVESQDAKLIVVGVDEQTILASILSQDAKLGMILLEMKKAVASIRKEVAR